MGIFSTTNNYHTNNVPYEKEVTINEHKAPTDESVRLLNEMQEKAKKNIIQTIKIGDNVLNAVVIYYQDDFIGHNINFTIRFTFNGKEYFIQDSIDKYEYKFDSYMKLGSEIVHKMLFTKFSELITIELMKQSIDFDNSKPIMKR